MTELSAKRRILCLWLPRLSTDRLQRQWARKGVIDNRPLVLILKAENAMRLSAVDATAARLGLHPGMALADARAMIPELAVHDADEKADAELLARLADWCERYSPLVALDGKDGLLLDVTGVTHLFGAGSYPPLEGGSKSALSASEKQISGRGHSPTTGHHPSPKFASQISTLPQGEGEKNTETAMLRHVCRAFAVLGFAMQGAVAGTSAAASALARFAPGTVAAPDADANAVTPLPVAALMADPAALHGLRRAGLKTIGAVASRGRGELAARFGQAFVTLLDRTLGHAASPISPRTPMPDCMAERRFAEPVVAEAMIAETIGALATSLGSVLERRGLGARALAASFFRADGKMRRVEIETAQPMRDAAMVARLFHERLASLAEPLDAGFGFDLIRLAAVRAESVQSRVTSFDENENEKREIAFLVDRLAVRFGAQRILRFHPQDTHIPEAAAVVLPAQYSMPGKTSWSRMRIDGEAPRRPLRLFEKPELVEVMAEVPDGPPVRFRWRRVLHHVARAEGPERIAMEWWRTARHAPTRDYFRIEDETGRRFWLYRDGLYARETADPRWYMHGVFA
ncbi:MAG: DNA polymerase Y family protein [Rhizomicrobium sp.]|jgi:protein ImuB